MLAAARANREMIADLSPQGQSALHFVGGLYIGQRSHLNAKP